ncbi:MAG TPA: hypothetical protein VJ728_08260 [Candidatus Binataceae bacterium]|nr:hypothetical protein [Candidatus Binataceae bacterium]
MSWFTYAAAGVILIIVGCAEVWLLYVWDKDLNQVCFGPYDSAEELSAVPDDMKTIELWRCLYDSPCRVKNCKAKATVIARSMDAGGRPEKQYELCRPHADQVVERERGRGREIVRRDLQ